ncbi:hypothetical protein Q4493_08975 [Colwellia sp. 1_MG-2023]|uniref:hypothetical protein n=1 Tax=Colwellia sp. 1_MG-2023 TaxID=3062649 RepID=UPI0026E34E2E|nr:hypothetical protein [Colwellia sp. 1_MG-2023]MDO6445902.1 hypothetical protein [Colwellia sp. 1_MG-2023]
MSDKIEIPKWFTITAIIAFVWNLLGLMAFFSHITMTPEMISELPAQEQALYKDIPLWATAAFAIAVFAGALGSLLLVLKKAIAKLVLIASVLGVVVQNIHSFVVIDSMAVYGVASIIMPTMVLIIAVALVLLASKAEKHEWLS